MCASSSMIAESFQDDANMRASIKLRRTAGKRGNLENTLVIGYFQYTWSCARKEKRALKRISQARVDGAAPLSFLMRRKRIFPPCQPATPRKKLTPIPIPTSDFVIRRWRIGGPS